MYRVFQVIVAIISYLEAMLLMYLSYKVRHTHTHTIFSDRFISHRVNLEY